MSRRTASGPRDSEITIELQSVRELLAAPRDPLVGSQLRLLSGIDELTVKQAVRSYCELRLRETENDLRAFRADAFRSLGVGMTLFVAGIAASTALTTSSDPHWIKTFFGDGLALVIAWIGAWYPLDTLIHYTRPYRRTRSLLQVLREIELEVLSSPPIGSAERERVPGHPGRR